jgi:hypothetical protein
MLVMTGPLYARPFTAVERAPAHIIEYLIGMMRSERQQENNEYNLDF